MHITEQTCEGKTNPPEFTKGQIDKCMRCKNISAKKRWCCLFGVRIVAKEKYPSWLKMGASVAKESAKYIAAGRPKRSSQEQGRCKAICERPCDYYVAESKLGPRCSQCGCCISLKTLWATAQCPMDKWKIGNECNDSNRRNPPEF